MSIETTQIIYTNKTICLSVALISVETIIYIKNGVTMEPTTSNVGTLLFKFENSDKKNKTYKYFFLNLKWELLNKTKKPRSELRPYWKMVEIFINVNTSINGNRIIGVTNANLLIYKFFIATI